MAEYRGFLRLIATNGCYKAPKSGSLNMGVIVRYVQPRKGRLEFRRAFPDSLRSILGRREFIRSLEARDIKDAGALDRYQAALADYDRSVSLARKEAEGTFDYLDDGRIEALASAFKVTRLQEDEDQRSKGLADPELHEAAQDGYADMLTEGDRRPGLHVQYWGDDAQGLARAQGWRLDPQTESFTRLCRKLAVAAIEANQVKLARDAGETSPTPAPVVHADADAPRPAKGAANERTFQEVAERLLGTDRLAWGGATLEASRTALRFFREAVGDLKPSQIDRLKVGTYLDLLAQKPSRVPAESAGLALPDLVKAYEGRDVKRLSPKTLKDHLSKLSALWGKALEEGYLSQLGDAPANPFKRRIPLPARRETPQELTLSELQAVFSLPIFTKGERPTRGKGEACFWIPLILLWTGSRPEEVAQLIVTDFTTDDRGRTWLTYTDEGEHPAKGLRSLKTQRYQSGRRTIPLPQPLIAFGLLDYVAHLRATGEQALFPRLRLKSKERRELYPCLGEWFAPYLKSKVAFENAKTQRPLRALRHNWTTAARASGIAQDAREYIQGHKGRGGSMNDWYGDRKPLSLQIDRLSFKGLDLSGVRRWVTPADCA